MTILLYPSNVKIMHIIATFYFVLDPGASALFRTRSSGGTDGKEIRGNGIEG